MVSPSFSDCLCSFWFQLRLACPIAWPLLVCQVALFDVWLPFPRDCWLCPPVARTSAYLSVSMLYVRTCPYSTCSVPCSRHAHARPLGLSSSHIALPPPPPPRPPPPYPPPSNPITHSVINRSTHYLTHTRIRAHPLPVRSKYRYHLPLFPPANKPEGRDKKKKKKAFRYHNPGTRNYQ